MRRRYVFSGTVQHVGFRYRAVTAASKLNITGWIQNLSDGRVVMEAQGEKDALDSLAAGLLETRYGKIETAYTEIREEEDTGKFSVRF